MRVVGFKTESTGKPQPCWMGHQQKKPTQFATSTLLRKTEAISGGPPKEDTPSGPLYRGHPGFSSFLRAPREIFASEVTYWLQLESIRGLLSHDRTYQVGAELETKVWVTIGVLFS